MEQDTFNFGGEAASPPVKLCECGCGEPAPLARQTNNKLGKVKGQPQRFIRGHAAKSSPSSPPPPGEVRLCGCGCGQPVPIATFNNKNRGITKGQPMRFARGHNGRVWPRKPELDLTPSPEKGLCECGCGQPAPIAAQTNTKLGYVRGQAQRFIRGHGNRGRPSPRRLPEIDLTPSPEKGLCQCGCGLPARSRSTTTTGPATSEASR